jgi:hypothetical protein
VGDFDSCCSTKIDNKRFKVRDYAVSLFISHINYYSDNQIRKDEVDEACGTFEREVHAGVWCGNL